MDTLSLLGKRLPRYLSFTTKTLQILLHSILHPLLTIQWFSPIVSFIDAILVVYFRALCSLSSCILRLDDDQTSMHFWAPCRPDPRKPNLLMIHGYGGDSKWQFIYQVGQLTRCFNVYAPDLLFFGKSFSGSPERSVAFQAKCVAQGMKRLGVTRYSVYAISYGGYVAYSMADTSREAVEKMVIVSSGIVWTEEQKEQQLGKLGKDVVDVLLPQKAEDLRLLLNLAMHKFELFKMYPDFVLQGFINAIGKSNRKEKKELVEHLLAKKPDGYNLPIIPQETLLVWGDNDKVFPLEFGQQLQRHLGSKAKLKILKDTGHAVNMEAANLLNDSIKDFLLGIHLQQNSSYI